MWRQQISEFSKNMRFCHALTCLHFGIFKRSQGWPIDVPLTVNLSLPLITSDPQNCNCDGNESQNLHAKAGYPVSAHKQMNILLLGTGRAEEQAKSWLRNIIFVELWSSA